MAAGPVRTVCPVAAMLGEGPVWVGREAALYFVDIKGKRVHRFDPATEALRSWDAPLEIGWVLPAAGGGFVAGMEDGLHLFDPEAGTFARLHHVEPHLPGNRLNDATVDPAGRIWFGTMDNQEDAVAGRLYAHERGAVRDSGLPPVRVTNGPSFSPDGRTLYHTDTFGGVIHAIEVADDGSLGASREFVRIDPADGYPDGSVVDAEGCVWTGVWGGWSVRRYDPAGALMEAVRLPAANITKIAFGGPDLRTAFATSARKGLDAAALAEQPEAGNLFAFDAGVAGLPVPEAILE